MLFCLSPRCCPHHTTLEATVAITFCKRLLTDAREVVVVQLQFLDLMNRKESEAVPMDAKARADLIDLMARILVAVFQMEGGKDDRSPVQPQDQAGAPGSQSHCLPAAIQPRNKYGRIRKASVFSMTWPNGCVLWVGNKWRSWMGTLDPAR